MRELREFRAHHPDFERAGIVVAGVSRDTPESNHAWRARLHLPYPLLSDREGEVGRALGLVRRLGIGGWTIDLQRRCSMLVDGSGRIAAVWGDVKVRGHALEVLEAARGLGVGPISSA